MATFLLRNKFNYFTVTLIILLTGPSCGDRFMPSPDFIPDLYDSKAPDLPMDSKITYKEEQDISIVPYVWVKPRLGRRKKNQKVNVDEDQYEQGLFDDAAIIVESLKPAVPLQEDTRMTDNNFTPRLGRNLREEELKTSRKASRQQQLMTKLGKGYVLEIFK